MKNLIHLSTLIFILCLIDTEVIAQLRPIAVIEGVLDVHDVPDSSSLYIGKNAGLNADAEIKENTTLGSNAGAGIKTASKNTLVGSDAGRFMSKGLWNTYIGMQAGGRDSIGTNNTLVGYSSGHSLNAGHSNTFIGSSAGPNFRNGLRNTFIGTAAGDDVVSGNDLVFIGNHAGPSSITTLSSRLYIDVDTSDNPLIYGEFDNDLLRINGDFQVQSGSANILDIGSANDSAGYYWSEEDDQKAFGLIYDGVGSSGNNKLHLREFFGTHGNMVTFKGDGSVGIGKTNPEVRLHVEGGTDVNMTSGGFAQFGPSTGSNIAIDEDEIMARNDGNPNKLFVNIGNGANGQDGGTVHFGGKLVVGNNNTSDGPGQLRYNLSTNDFEGRNNTEWCSLTSNRKVQTMNLGPGAWSTIGTDHEFMIINDQSTGATSSSSSSSSISHLFIPIQLPAESKILEVSYYFKNAHPMQPDLEMDIVGYHISGDPALRTESHLVHGKLGGGFQTKTVTKDLLLDSDRMYAIRLLTPHNTSVDYTTSVEVLGAQIKYILP